MGAETWKGDAQLAKHHNASAAARRRDKRLTAGLLLSRLRSRLPRPAAAMQASYARARGASRCARCCGGGGAMCLHTQGSGQTRPHTS